MGLLSWIVFLPTLFALAVLALPRGNDRAVRVVAFTGMLLDFVATLVLVKQFLPTGGMQLVERLTWVESFGIEYHLGVDGISLWLLVLTGFIGPIAGEAKLLNIVRGASRKRNACFQCSL